MSLSVGVMVMTYSGGAAPTSGYAAPEDRLGGDGRRALGTGVPELGHRPINADDPVAISQWVEGRHYLGGQPCARARGHGLYGVSITAHARHRKRGNKEALAG
jgi:hypothetical protein